jgi:hypothetical protein
MRLVDLTGQKFGYLLVLNRAENKIRGRPRWLCRCDCGNAKCIDAGNLRSGASRSCGCRESLGVPPKDLINRRFGRLLVIEIVKNQPPIWRCRCDCGKIVVKKSSYLLNKTKSCGCLWRETAGDATRKRPFESLYNNLKRRALRKNLQFDLTYEYFVSLTKLTRCHYCDTPVKWSEYALDKNGRATNLDRKDSNLGYLKNNVVVCCIRCNRAKLDHFTYSEWVKIGSFIKNNVILTKGLNHEL